MAHARTIVFIYILILIPFSASSQRADAELVESLQESPIEAQLAALENYGFRPQELTTPEERQQVEQKLREFAGAQTTRECDFSEKVGSRGNKKSIALYDQIISDMTPFILQNYSSDCVANLLTHYMAEKFRNPNQLRYNVNCLHQEVNPQGESTYRSGYQDIRCPRMLQEKGLFERTSAMLSDALFHPSSDLRVCAGDDFSPSSFEELSEMVARLTENQSQIDECTETQVGETRPRNNKDYSLTRNSANEYTANVVIDFQKRGENLSAISPEEMMERVRTCLNETNQLYRSSNGEQFNFNILSPQDQENLPEDQRLKSHNIKYQAAEFRQNSLAYMDSISCSTIAHEVFHLIGLLDEYHESGDGSYHDEATGLSLFDGSPEIEVARANGTLRFQPTNNLCRSIPSRPSVMSKHHDAFQEVAGVPINCRCQEDAYECRRVLALNSPALTLLQASTFTFPNFGNLCSVDFNYGLDRYGGSNISFDFNSMSPQELANFKAYEVVSDTPREVIIQENSGADLINRDDPNSNFAVVYPRYFRCSCVGKDLEDCESKLNLLRTRDLADYLVPYCFRDAGIIEDNLSNADVRGTIPIPGNQEMQITQTEDSYSIIPPARNPGAPLLHPAHMTFIKFAGCRSRATKYRTCQSYAYVNDCPGRPAYCDEEEQWLMQEQ